MRRWFAVITLAVLILVATAPSAQAGSTAAKVALGLASFAVFNQLVGAFAYPRPVYAYTPAYVVAAPPAVVYAPPAVLTAPAPTVVQYPHGRYELRVEGSRYVWVWIPNPPPPPAAYQAPGSPPPAPPGAEAAPAPGTCKPTGKYVKTPQGLLPECE